VEAPQEGTRTALSSAVVLHVFTCVSSSPPQYGHTFTFSVLNTRFIAITQPEDVDYMLKSNFENFVKGYARVSLGLDFPPPDLTCLPAALLPRLLPMVVRARFNDNLHELLGYGIFNVDGNMWKVQRCANMRVFHGCGRGASRCATFSVRAGSKLRICSASTAFVTT